MKLFLAAAGASDSSGAVRTGAIKRAFISFFQIYKCKLTATAVGRMKEVYEHAEETIVDSGAHSFFSMSSVVESAGVVKRKSRVDVTPQEYFDRYVHFLKNVPGWDYFVELDIGEVVGQNKVLEWRRVLEREGLYDRCITVYHPRIMSRREYSGELRDSVSGYVGLEGVRNGRPPLPYAALVKEAFDAGVKVHGFAMIKQKYLTRYPFYSVDSSSWKASLLYGVRYLKHKSGVGVSTARPTKRQRNAFLRSLNESPERIGGRLDDTTVPVERTMDNIRMMLRLEAEVTELWRKRGVDWEAAIARRLRA